jgi:hypothetical protein
MFSVRFPALRLLLRSFAGKRNGPEPNERNGLRARCRIMVNKITVVPKSGAGVRVSGLDGKNILRLNQAMRMFLGRAVSSGASSVRGTTNAADRTPA